MMTSMSKDQPYPTSSGHNEGINCFHPNDGMAIPLRHVSIIPPLKNDPVMYSRKQRAAELGISHTCTCTEDMPASLWWLRSVYSWRRSVILWLRSVHS